jgi:hypothetical protein
MNETAEDVLRELRAIFYPKLDNHEKARIRRVLGEDKGYSEEQCIRCGWTMGQPPLNCQNDDTPHAFPSQGRRA